MKVKIFREDDKPFDEFGICKIPIEDRINKFIADKKVIDIKYKASTGDELEEALVMYEEKIIMKCKTFAKYSGYIGTLSEEINEFVVDKNIKAIKYHNAQFRDGDEGIIATVFYE